jgi:hypothetical protein
MYYARYCRLRTVFMFIGLYFASHHLTPVVL